MKKLYSVILLFSLAIGILQPVLPMIEYQLHRGDIIELLETEQCEYEHTGKNICCAMDSDCTKSEKDSDPNLLDIDYYPLALQIAAIPSPEIFPNRSDLYLPAINEISSPAFLPIPPPPRLS